MRALAISLLIASAAFGQSSRDEWRSYGKNYSGWRYSELNEINTANIAQLRPQWIFQSGVNGKQETTPLVFNNMMYITAPSNHAFALDGLTGRPVWHYQKQVPAGTNVCCGQVNRGFAAIGDKLFKVNLEATLVAIDAKSGRTLWETTIDDVKKGFSTTVAPLAVKNLVIVGVAGAEFGVRGFIDAYDATTGKRAWRFYTVAGPGQPGANTWAGDSWTRGGGSIWITGTYDPETNLTYWGTGNPGPDFFGDDRKGDNLYTCSLVALDADTGQLKWHYQFTPHDVHDWDAVADPVLMDLNIDGKKVKAVVQANRNGYFYVLDRTNGKFIKAKSYTQTSWADGIGADGKPKVIANQDPTEDGNRACPGIAGGHNWNATAYSPQTGLYYFNSTDGCQLYYKTRQEFIEGMWYQGSTTAGFPTEPTTGSVIAVDPATGTTKWRWEMVTPPTSGMLATAGNLVFGGDREGYLFAFDARTGKVVWKFQTGGVIIAPPISYALNGKQYIAVGAGASILTFAVR